MVALDVGVVFVTARPRAKGDVGATDADPVDGAAVEKEKGRVLLVGVDNAIEPVPRLLAGCGVALRAIVVPRRALPLPSSTPKSKRTRLDPDSAHRRSTVRSSTGVAACPGVETKGNSSSTATDLRFFVAEAEGVE